MLAEAPREAYALRQAQLRAASLGRPILLSITRPVGSLDALPAFAAARAQRTRIAWLRPTSGEAFVARGVAHRLDATGPHRVVSIARAWQDLLAEAVISDPLGQSWSGPLLLGGFAFDPLRPSTALWAGFPAARFVLPSRVLVQRAGAAWQVSNTLVVPPGFTWPGVPAPSLAAEEAPLDPAAWRSVVGRLAAGIRSGELGPELTKVVLARAERVQCPPHTSPDLALERLARAYPTCTLFAFAEGDSCFLGATPERLVSVQQGIASTMALAASARRGTSPAEDDALADALLRDPKERSEHQIVLGAVRALLQPVCTRVVADAEPRVERLPNVQHLLTPVRGQLAPGCSVLDVVEQLHPTPAVGGSPRQRALALIRAWEGLDRGWYAGALGWLDRGGDGEFVVGIRSALLRGRRATLFAGCGIVADSDPAAELAESEWKLRPMRHALGIGGA